jgi:hypothetical protein
VKTFLGTYPLYTAHGSRLALDAERLPEELKSALNQVNGNWYANGFFSFVLPAGVRDYCSLFNLDPAECHPFLKCAFGHLLVYHAHQYKLLDPLVNSVDVLGEEGNLNFVVNVALCDRSSVEGTLMMDVYEQAFPRLGAPQADEIYAFVPALGLGGSRTPVNVRKAKMAVEMAILTQL